VFELSVERSMDFIRLGSLVNDHAGSRNDPVYVGVLISLRLFLFPIFGTTKRIVFRRVKEIRTTKS
jgi:hypothetical protein